MGRGVPSKRIKGTYMRGNLTPNISKIDQKHIKHLYLGFFRIGVTTKMYPKDILEDVSKRNDIEKISKKYYGAVVEFRTYEKHIQNISKTYHRGGPLPGRVCTNYPKQIGNISKTYHGVETEIREYQQHIENISKTDQRNLS